MTKFNAKIIDKIGLHARPATALVMQSGKFRSTIKINSKGKTGNLKSIMNVMSLGIKHNDEIEIIAEGDDEAVAIETIQKLMKDNKLI